MPVGSPLSDTEAGTRSLLRPRDDHERLTVEVRVDSGWSASVGSGFQRDLSLPSIEDDVHSVEVNMSPLEFLYQLRPTA